ncbi:MAG: hypothetical protein NC253_00890 [Ruminococcus sp.]|nr:hypothetical protein [Ruminococcus sp.]MCM1382642.1 hypothetical protein [Muribaculaceae bacterium]MCM1478975.1 hypothetical protein [Muribaculaceae bacterium]
MLGKSETIELNQLSGVEADKEKTVKFILKHGCEIIVKCKDFSVTQYGGDVVGYEIKGIGSGDYPMYIDNSEIAAVVYERSEENG